MGQNPILTDTPLRDWATHLWSLSFSFFVEPVSKLAENEGYVGSEPLKADICSVLGVHSDLNRKRVSSKSILATQ